VHTGAPKLISELWSSPYYIHHTVHNFVLVLKDRGFLETFFFTS